MHDFSVLSDIEFEGLVADLLAAEFSTSVERFAAGADGGVDLRWRIAGGGLGVGQCKHYSRSSISQLLSAARGEIPHLRSIAPADYWFITSFDVTIAQKKKIFEGFKGWMRSPNQVLGIRDLHGLLTRHEHVERRHLKLWLSTGCQLFWSLHSHIANRSNALRDRVERSLPRYVANSAYERAGTLLDDHRVCVISGIPGIGKTTLAHVLLANLMARGFEPVEVSADIEEAWTALDGATPQAFLYDDFLGQLSFTERLGKNEDRRLTEFIAKLGALETKRLILTTREYILQDARQSYDGLNDLNQRLHFVLELTDYTRRDKASILYNHLWHADISVPALNEVASGGYKEIVDHAAYSPRLIEYCTGSSFDTTSIGYPRRVVDTLDHPVKLWKIAFEKHLSLYQQLLVIALATLPHGVPTNSLLSAQRSLSERLRTTHTDGHFRSALSILEGTFIRIERTNGIRYVSFSNPSIREFTLDRLKGDEGLVSTVLDSAVYFEQLRQLYIQSTRHSLLDCKSVDIEGYRAVLESVRGNFVTRLMDTFNGPAARTQAEGYTAGTNSLEGRLLFCIGLPIPWRPATHWFMEQLGVICQRWASDVGEKAQAVSLLRELAAQFDDSGLSSHDLAKVRRCLKRAGKALDRWLGARLEDTVDDWVPYLERMERDHNVILAADLALASRFEDFALQELECWYPSTPYIGELLEYANKFRSNSLIDKINEKIEEERKDDEIRAERLKDKPVPVPREPDVSHQTLDRMFKRLATKPSVTGN